MLHQSHVLSCPTKLNGYSPLPVSHIGTITTCILPFFFSLSLCEILRNPQLNECLLLKGYNKLSHNQYCKPTMTFHLTRVFLLSINNLKYSSPQFNTQRAGTNVCFFFFFGIVVEAGPNLQDLVVNWQNLCSLLWQTRGCVFFRFMTYILHWHTRWHTKHRLMP